MASWSRRDIELAVELLDSHPDSQSFRLSQAISALLKEFDERESELEEVLEDIESLNSINGELSADIENLEDKLVNAEEDLDSLRSEYETLQDTYEGVMAALEAVNVQE